MKKIENTIASMDAAQMIGKNHSKLLRDIRIYIIQLIEANIGFNEFFRDSTYKDSIGRTLPCYQITKKGCEFIAHKMTGTKGTIFTARYINRFHEMEDMLSSKEPERPWFIRNLKGTDIVLERDFIAITGVDIKKHKAFYREDYFRGGYDWNGCGWKCNNEEFKATHGFDYGDDDCMLYFYLRGVPKALRVLEYDKKVTMNRNAKEILLKGLKYLEEPKKEIAVQEKTVELGESRRIQPIQICITVNENGVKIQ